MSLLTTEPAAGAGPGTGRRRVLLAPVTVTPCKPLTHSHLKGLLWTDVMYRATSHLADVTYRYSHTTYDCTEQTAGFWEYLDRVQGDIDYSGLTENAIGELYVRYRAEGGPVTPDALRPYREAVEHHGWTHPAAVRILEHWTSQYAALGLHDPGLDRHQPPAFGLEEALTRLDGLGFCLDLRPDGGPVYLDATRYGMPLRQIVSADGQPNYLACALRELLPLAPEHDEVVLLFDQDLDPDYQLLQRVLSSAGPDVHRVALGRVPIDGRIRSSRHGEWRGHTVADLIDDIAAAHDRAVTSLGVRLYFIATLGPGQRQSFRDDLLRGCLDRARRLLDREPAGYGTPAETAAAVVGALAGHRGRDHLHVDPYRLTSGLLARRRRVPVSELATAVFT
ncbi:hypothetical protein [Streptomyces sp. NPDC059788]|uniref:hypothetical protein n=1 Tax=Streptomyces sp. NPDC059788 TaxID=3346948 RepID=UPI00364B9BD7